MNNINTFAPQKIWLRRWRGAARAVPGRGWLGKDVVASAWHNALSCSFPRGEAYFIEALQAARPGADAALAEALRGFIHQEATHAQAHLAFNRHLVAAGYDLAAIDARLAAFIEAHRSSWPVLNIAATAALEHLTALIAADVLGRPAAYAGADPQVMALWRWHAAEELEHKGVAFDAWRHVTRGWKGWRRWRIRCLVLAVVSANFLKERMADTLDLLAQDGLTGWRARAAVWGYVWGWRGLAWRMLPGWLRFFRPGFHPWQRDDRALAEQALADPAVAACLSLLSAAPSLDAA